MDVNKRRIYDQYGSLGLKLAEQIGEEVRDVYAYSWLSSYPEYKVQGSFSYYLH